MNIGVIARRAGVSRSRVSYALSGKRPVANSTRRRIQDVIDELGYRPNPTARPLRRAGDGFEAAVAERGLDGIEVPCGEDDRSGQECPEALLRSHPDVTAVTTISEAALPGIRRTPASRCDRERFGYLAVPFEVAWREPSRLRAWALGLPGSAW